MATALSSDAQIYYEVHGSGPAVLFVHGSGGHHAAWWQQVAALSPSYSVITVDLRGFGNSRWRLRRMRRTQCTGRRRNCSTTWWRDS